MIDPAQQTADLRLMERVATGDHEAFGALYDRLSGPLFSLAYRMLGDRAEAEDALQEASMQLWRRAANYESGRSSVFAWAVMITRSKTIDRLRARGRRQRVMAGSVDEENAPEPASEESDAADNSVKKDEAMRVRLALRSLPDEQREAIEMAFLDGLTHAEIASQKNEPLGTVKARIRRGLMRLRNG